MKTEKTIKVGVLYNAFDPTQIKYSDLTYRKNVKLKTVLRDLPTDCEWKIGLNGVPVTVEKDGNTRLKPNDSIQLVVVPRGGGFKNILRMVALVAVVVGAAVLFGPGGALAFSVFGSAAAGMALGMAVFTLAGGLLINALLPPKPPKTDGADSTSYGYDGAKNTAQQGATLPVVYGRYRVAGNYVNLFTENVGDDQYLYGRTVLSDGEIQAVTLPKINDQPIANFSDVEWGARMGTQNEAVNPYFNRNIAQVTKNIKLTGSPSSDWTTHVTSGEIDKFQIGIGFPKGLVHITKKKGKKELRGVTIAIRYRIQGTSTWTNWPNSSIAGPGTVYYIDKRLKAIRKTIESQLLPKGIYEIQVRRSDTEGDQEHDIDETYLNEVAEITTSATNMSTVANGWYKIKMNEQLNNVPNVTWLVDGVKVNHYDINGNVTEKSWTDNPAWIVLDMLIGEERGTPGIFSIDFPTFVAWAEWCELQGLKFNGVFDTTTTLWDACVDVLKIGHAAFTRIGTKLSVAIDKPTAPSMLFGPGNIIKDTFEINYVAMNDRANEFELSYYDRDDDNAQKTVRIVDPDADRRGDIPRAVSFSMPGIDNFEQAEKEVWYQLYNNRYLRRTVSFDAPIESIGLNIGDVALVQHDVVNWGTAGRVDGGTTTQVLLDKPVEMEAGKNYSLLVIHNFINRAIGNVTSKTGNVLTVTGLSAEITLENVKRIVQGSVDRQVIGINKSGTTYYVSIDGDNDFNNGSVVFVDTDVIEERDVTYVSGEVTTVQVTSAFTSAPLKYSNYMFGDKEIVKKPYRLKGISGTGFDNRKLTLIEYNPNVYLEPENLLPLPSTTMPKIVNHVNGLAFVNDPYATYDATVVNGILSWSTANVRNYSGVDIYISVNDGAFSFYRTVFNATEAQVMFQADTDIVFKVVAFNDTLTRASMASAPTVAVVVDSDTIRSELTPPQNLQVEQVSYIATALVEATWEAPVDIDAEDLDRLRYRVQVKPDGETLWDEYGVTDQLLLRIGDLKVGVHIVRVRAEIGSTYSEWVEDAVATSFTSETIHGRDLDPPSVPSGLTATSEITDLGAKLNISWSAPADPDVAGYVVSIAEGSGTAIEYVTTATTHSVDGLLRNQLYHIRVKAYDDSGNYGSFTAEITHTTALDTVAPAIPVGLEIEAGFQNMFLGWINPADADLSGIEIYENTVDNSATATLINTVNALPATIGRFTRSGLEPGSTRFYWIKAVDTSNNKSGFSTVISASTYQVGETDISDGAIVAEKIAAGAVIADKILAGTIVGNHFDTGTSLPGTITVGTTGVSIGTIENRASDPAARVNSYTTQIDPGKILISGGTSLSSWRNGSDNTKIEGGSVAANTITANKLRVGNRAINSVGIDFQVIGNIIYWTTGSILCENNAGSQAAYTIAAGNYNGNGTSWYYIYWTLGGTSFQVTTDWAAAQAGDNVIIATWYGGQAVSVNYGGTIIDGNRITTGTVTADRLNVGYLSAISAEIGLLRTASSGARMEIESNQLRVYDSSGVMRVRLGLW